MSNFEKFNKTLPSKNEFYSPLSGTGISDKEYQHVLNFWNKIEIETMKYCHDLELKRDIFLLADLFKNFKNSCLENYGPALSWGAMLSMTKVKLDFISDAHMCFFLKKEWETVFNIFLKDTA